MVFIKEKDLEKYSAYKQGLTNALRDLGADPVPFLFVSTYRFGDGTELPLLVVEKTAIAAPLRKKLLEWKKGDEGKKLKAKTAEGSCFLEGGTLVVRVSKGELKKSDLKASQLPGVSDWKLGQAIAQDVDVGGNPIDVQAQKLAEWKSMYARSQRRMNAAEADLARLENDLQGILARYKTAVEVFQKNKQDDGAKQAKEQAGDVKLSAQKALQEKRKEVQLLKGMLEAVDKAATDEAKAEVLFEKGKYQLAVEALRETAYRSMMATDEAIMVLGRTIDTHSLKLSQEEQGRLLAVEPTQYSLTANDAFMKGGIDIKAQFQLLTPLTKETQAKLKTLRSGAELIAYANQVKEKEPALWNSNRGEPAVSCREIGQLLDDGYWFSLHPRDWPKDKELVQFMFPRGLKPAQQAEILKGLKEGLKKSPEAVR